MTSYRKYYMVGDKMAMFGYDGRRYKYLKLFFAIQFGVHSITRSHRISVYIIWLLYLPSRQFIQLEHYPGSLGAVWLSLRNTNLLDFEGHWAGWVHFLPGVMHCPLSPHR
jgi:hypothetical protein